MGAIKLISPVTLDHKMSTIQTEHLAINQWPEEDRPREKLQRLGVRNMSDIELLTILISNGTRERSALDLARDLYMLADKNLLKLSAMSLREYQKVKGIGMAKAISIKAALELSARILRQETNETIKIDNSDEAYKFLKPVFFNLPHEEFWVVCLNKRNEIISKLKIGEGNDKFVLVDVKQVISCITEAKAHAFICAHNHPGGTKEPSQHDVNLTKNILAASKYLQIKFMDHLILCGDSFYSFRDSERLDL